jgi:hypothetical protein
MAVGAYELALGDFGDDGALAVTAEQSTHICNFAQAGKVIPRHRGWMKDAATIDTRPAAFQLSIPLGHLRVSSAFL